MGEFSLGFFVGDGVAFFGGALGDGAGDLGFAVGADGLGGWWGVALLQEAGIAAGLSEHRLNAVRWEGGTEWHGAFKFEGALCLN